MGEYTPKDTSDKSNDQAVDDSDYGQAPDSRAEAIAEIVAHAEELGLTPEETAKAVADYERSLDEGDGDEASDTESEEVPESELTAQDILRDPSALSEQIDKSMEDGTFDALEQSLNKLAEDVDSLAESMSGLGEVFDKFLEVLHAFIELLRETLEMLAERDKLETQEEKDEMTREIQKKIDEFAAKWGG